MYISMFITLFISELAPGITTFKEALYNTFGTLIVYYMSFWIGFIICILVLDIFLFNIDKKPQNTIMKLFIEWLTISAPFAYWLIRYGEWIFLVSSLAFMLGQFLRRLYIFKILR